MSVYEDVLKDKVLAAKVLLPIIECEGRVMSTSVVSFIQSESNFGFLEKIYKICEGYGWVEKDRKVGIGSKPIYNEKTSYTKLGERVRFKGKSFSLSPLGFKEIYSLAGPFVSERKDKYAKILCGSAGTIGEKRQKVDEDTLLELIGRYNEIKTCDLQIHIFDDLEKSVTYGGLSQRLNYLVKRNKLKRKKEGRAYLYYIAG